MCLCIDTIQDSSNNCFEDNKLGCDCIQRISRNVCETINHISNFFNQNFLLRNLNIYTQFDVYDHTFNIPIAIEIQLKFNQKKKN